MATKTFTSAARRISTEPITFDLDGETYSFIPQKTTALAVSGLNGGADQIKGQLNWLGAGLSKEQGDRILARLTDTDDDLELRTVIEIVNYLLTEMSGRPTGPSPE
jgi:hypothetical protein